MALETLKGVNSIGNFVIKGKDEFGFINVDHEENSIKFRIQNGPIKEKGLNGCQIDTMIEAAKIIITGFNNKYPCYENVLALNALKDALDALELRTKKRDARGVEGLDKE